MNLSGWMIRRLMRKHRVTMRAIKAQHGVTLTRVREVRQGGVRGFMGDEWFYMITGRWPDESVTAGPSSAVAGVAEGQS